MCWSWGPLSAPALAACGGAAVLTACCAAADTAPASRLRLTIWYIGGRCRAMFGGCAAPVLRALWRDWHIDILRTHRGQSAGAGCCSACAAMLPANLQAERASPVRACVWVPCLLRLERVVVNTASVMQHLQEGPPVAPSSFRASPLHARRCGTPVSVAPVRCAQAARLCSSRSGRRRSMPWRRTTARPGWAARRCPWSSSLRTPSGRTRAPGRHAVLLPCATVLFSMVPALCRHSFAEQRASEGLSVCWGCFAA